MPDQMTVLLSGTKTVSAQPTFTRLSLDGRGNVYEVWTYVFTGGTGDHAALMPNGTYEKTVAPNGAATWKKVA